MRKTVQALFSKRFFLLENGCWLWIGAKNRDGYGVIEYRPERGKKKHALAHRISYEYFIGKIPLGLTLDHLCRKPGCVNPRHLEPVTSVENVMRGETITAKFARATHCVNGHPFDGNNLIQRKAGGRACRTCHIQNLRKMRRNRGIPSRQNRKALCKRGHLLDRVNSAGKQYCHTCGTILQRERRARQSAR